MASEQLHYFDTQNNPHLKVKISVSSWTEVDCLIDTGFSGGIALPVSLLTGFKQKPIAPIEREDTFLTLHWGG